MNVQAVIFDLDNTLYHYDPCNHAGLVAAHQKLNQQLVVPYEQFIIVHNQVRSQLAVTLENQAASHNRAIFFKRIVEQLTGAPHPDLVIDMFNLYWDNFLDIIEPHPDAHHVLATLSKRMPLAMLSNHITAIQLRKIKRLKFAPYFTHIVTSEETGIEKPDPAIFGWVLDLLEIEPQQAVMIGDHPLGDIRGAREAGLKTIHMTEFRRDPKPEQADHVISQLIDVLDILEQADDKEPG